MAASSVVTFRIAPELLAALQDKVRREGRTVSAALVELVRANVRPKRAPSAKRRTIGMFSDFDAPDLDDLLQLRRTLSRRLTALPAPARKRR